MAKSAKHKPRPTFEVRFKGRDLDLEQIPLRAVSDALSAVQDLASGRNPFETAQVPFDKGIGLIEVRRGSAIYSCFSRAPKEAIDNLKRVAELLASSNENSNGDNVDDGLVSAMKPIQSLSDVAKSVGCNVEIHLGKSRSPVFVIDKSDYEKISKRLLLTGESSVTGKVQRVGGKTGMRCLLSVPGRRRLLYCTVKSRELARKLGQHLYETITATGTATWIHRTWRMLDFSIADFGQPELGDPGDALRELREAGLSAWDSIEDPESYLREFRG